MDRKSDHVVETRISATEASRSFSRLLDDVAAGRRFVVHRHGRDVCRIGPAPVHGRPASDVLEILGARTAVTLDGGFGEDLLEILGAETPDERPQWDS